MSITRTQLETRLSELKTQLEKIREQFVLTTGAIADVEYWLKQDEAGVEDSHEPSTVGARATLKD